MKKIIFVTLVTAAIIFGLNACRNIRPPTLPVSGTTTVTPAVSKTLSVTSTATITVTATQTATQTAIQTATKVVIRVNCGRAPDCWWCGAITGHTDSHGVYWNADQAYTAGNWGYLSGAPGYTTNNVINISPVGDQILYYYDRSGSPSNLLLYRFTVPNADYTVNLYFDETFFTSAGQRVFDMYINSVKVLSNFDILSTAGGQNMAINYSFNSTVSGGYIEVSSTASVSTGGMISGIEILQK